MAEEIAVAVAVPPKIEELPDDFVHEADLEAHTSASKNEQILKLKADLHELGQKYETMKGMNDHLLREEQKRQATLPKLIQIPLCPETPGCLATKATTESFFGKLPGEDQTHDFRYRKLTWYCVVHDRMISATPAGTMPGAPVAPTAAAAAPKLPPGVKGIDPNVPVLGPGEDMKEKLRQRAAAKKKAIADAAAAATKDGTYSGPTANGAALLPADAPPQAPPS